MPKISHVLPSQALLDSIPQILWLTDEHGQATYFNQQWWNYTGIDPEKYTSEDAIQAIHPEDQSEVLKLWAESFATGVAFSHQYRLRAKNGSYQWHLGELRPVPSEEGRLTQWIGTATNIDAQKSVELEFRGLSESVPHFVWRTNLEGKVTYANSLFTDYVGMSIHELDERAWATLIHPDDLEEVARKWVAAKTNGNRYVAQFRLRSKDGVYRWMLRHSTPLHDASGTLLGTIGATSDIHDLFLSNKEQATYAAKLSDIHWVTSELSKALTVADVIEVIRNRVLPSFGADSGAFYEPSLAHRHLNLLAFHGDEEIYPARCREVSFDQQSPVADSFNRNVAYFFESKEDLIEAFAELASMIADYGTRALVVLPLTLNDRQLGVIHFLYKTPQEFSSNIRQLMFNLIAHCAEALGRARMYDLSQKAIEARDGLISISSHELLTPVTSMMLQIQLADRQLKQQGHLPKDVIQKMIDQNMRQLQRLNKLVGDMLDLSRINSGKLTLQKSLTDLSQLARQVSDQLSGQINSSGCDLALSLDDGVVGHWDRDRVEQVIVNLLSNACRYARSGSVSLVIRKIQDRARLVVEDQGRGIAKQDHDRIFQRFERVASAQEPSGLGLGLFIVKQIVEAHEGTIRVESELGHGARFIVELPLQMVAT